jgi:hypothetical protein
MGVVYRKNPVPESPAAEKSGIGKIRYRKNPVLDCAAVYVFNSAITKAELGRLNC